MEKDSEDIKFVSLAKMAKRRKDVPIPDVNKEWNKFECKVNSKNTQSRTTPKTTYKLIAAAVMGAAAMYLAMFFINNFSDSHPSYIAYSHNNDPKEILLTSSPDKERIIHNDSLSFLVDKEEIQDPKEANKSHAKTNKKRSPRIQRLTTPRGMDFKIVLPDSSEVWLNAESTIEFPSAFMGKERVVKLKGEAYFNIAKNKKIPFIVTTENLKVKVTGTEFNFKSYNDEDPTVSLVEGSVDILSSCNDEKIVSLNAGQQATLEEDGNIALAPTDTYAVRQWKEGFFYFDDVPLYKVLKELGRWYNLGVIFKDKTLMKKYIHFSASRNESIDHAISSLRSLLKINIVLDSDNLIISSKN